MRGNCPHICTMCSVPWRSLGGVGGQGKEELSLAASTKPSSHRSDFGVTELSLQARCDTVSGCYCLWRLPWLLPGPSLEGRSFAFCHCDQHQLLHLPVLSCWGLPCGEWSLCGRVFICITSYVDLSPEWNHSPFPHFFLIAAPVITIFST